MGGRVSLYTPTKNAYNAVMLLESEIAEEKIVTGMKVETPDGWKAIKKVYKTIPLDVWCVVTSSKTLKCSGHHLLKTPVGCVEVRELGAGDIVETIDGFEVILCVYDTGEQEELYDITVDSEDGLFYSDGFISHNSTTFCTRQLLLTHLIPAYKSLYVVPHHKQLETYGARFGQMEMAFRIKSTVQNVYNKTYRNRSTVNMIHCGETSQAARGKSTDEVVIDECCASCTQLSVIGLDKTISICYIPVGAKITGFNENNERTTVEITAKKCNGYRRCYRIRTESGKELVCTGNHRLRTDRGWMYTIVLAGSLFGFSSSCESGGAGRLPAYEKSYAGISAGRYVDPVSSSRKRESFVQSRTVSARVQRLQEEVTDPARIKTGNEAKPGLRKDNSINDDALPPGLISATQYVLYKDSSRKDASAEVCDSGVGRPADLGSCSVVDMRRWFFKLPKSWLPDFHPLIFHGGDRPIDCMVSC